jgi:hypothetical protein
LEGEAIMLTNPDYQPPDRNFGIGSDEDGTRTLGYNPRCILAPVGEEIGKSGGNYKRYREEYV